MELPTLVKVAAAGVTGYLIANNGGPALLSKMAEVARGVFRDIQSEGIPPIAVFSAGVVGGLALTFVVCCVGIRKLGVAWFNR